MINIKCLECGVDQRAVREEYVQGNVECVECRERINFIEKPFK